MCPTVAAHTRSLVSGRKLVVTETLRKIVNGLNHRDNVSGRASSGGGFADHGQAALGSFVEVLFINVHSQEFSVVTGSRKYPVGYLRLS